MSRLGLPSALSILGVLQQLLYSETTIPYFSASSHFPEVYQGVRVRGVSHERVATVIAAPEYSQSGAY